MPTQWCILYYQSTRNIQTHIASACLNAAATSFRVSLLSNIADSYQILLDKHSSASLSPCNLMHNA